MTTTSATNPTSFIAPTTAGSTAANVDASLDKNGFLKLLAAQMKNQDPSSSQDPNQYFQTISQMTVVEQLTNLASQSSELLKQEKVSAAQNLLGRTVTYIGQNGLPVSGAVDGVDLSGSAPKISVAGVAGVDPTSLSSIA